MVTNRDKSGGISSELDSILKSVGSLDMITSLALQAIPGCSNHHLDLDAECGSLWATDRRQI